MIKKKLNSGRFKKGCKTHNRANLLGKRFDKLVVIKNVGSDKFDKASWMCLCDCGNSFFVSTGRLNKGDAKSCGCIPLSKTGLKGAIVDVYNGYKKAAKRRGILFNITPNDFEDLVYKNCFYCNTKPNNRRKSRFGDLDCIYNGLDRKDSSLGYELDNVVPCCANCNYAKSTMSVVEFITWAKRVFFRFTKMQSPSKDIKCQDG